MKSNPNPNPNFLFLSNAAPAAEGSNNDDDDDDESLVVSVELLWIGIGEYVRVVRAERVQGRCWGTSAIDL